MSSTDVEHKDSIKSEPSDLHALSGKVLVAEDDPDVHDFISFFLSKTQLQLTPAENGFIAVEAALAKDFDLILMDMLMPVMDGYAATRMLRDKGHTEPIIALTADARSTTVERCLAAGCTAYLAKPFESAELFSVLFKYCGKSSQAVKSGDESLLVLQSMDPDYLKLVLNFTNKLPSRLHEMQEAAKAKDWIRVAQLSHKLRGAAFAYPGVKVAVRKLEEAASAQLGDTAANCLLKIASLIEAIERRKPELESLLNQVTMDNTH